jgi:hypothetical protein
MESINLKIIRNKINGDPFRFAASSAGRMRHVLPSNAAPVQRDARTSLQGCLLRCFVRKI